MRACPELCALLSRAMRAPPRAHAQAHTWACIHPQVLRAPCTHALCALRLHAPRRAHAQARALLCVPVHRAVCPASRVFRALCVQSLLERSERSVAYFNDLISYYGEISGNSYVPRGYKTALSLSLERLRYEGAQSKTEKDRSTLDVRLHPLARILCCKASSHWDRQRKILMNFHRCLRSHEIKRKTKSSLFSAYIIADKSCNSFIYRCNFL